MTSSSQLLLLAGSIFVGIAVPPLAALCQPLLMPVVFLLFVAAIMQVRFSDAAVMAFRSTTLWVLLLWQLLVLPLIAAVALKSWLPSELWNFSVVALCACSITGTTAMSRLLGLNDVLSLVVCLAGSVLMPLPLYFFMHQVLGLPSVIDVAGYALRVLVFIGLPFLLVAAFRYLVSASVDARARQHAPSAAVLLLVVFGLCVMDGVQALLISRPWLILSYVLLSFGISVAVQLLTRVILSFLGSRDATTAALLSSFRNLGVVAALTGGSLGEHFLIFVGIWQLPMYTLPLLLGSVYRHHEVQPEARR